CSKSFIHVETCAMVSTHISSTLLVSALCAKDISNSAAACAHVAGTSSQVRHGPTQFDLQSGTILAHTPSENDSSRPSANEVEMVEPDTVTTKDLRTAIDPATLA